MNLDLLKALHDKLMQCSTDPRVRAVLITGAGKNFCAGGDVRDFAAHQDDLPSHLREVTIWLSYSIALMTQMDAPVVVAVHGVAAGGGGFGLVCAADLVLAEESSRFFGPGTRIGMTPDAGTTVTLTAAVGLRAAMEIVLTNPTLTSADALRMGLVNRVVPDGTVGDEGRVLAASIAAGPQLANAAAKRLLWDASAGMLSERMAAESMAIAKVAESPDVIEGLASVQERREPRFA